MAPKKRTTRTSPATKTTTTPLVTNAQLKALIDQGVANALQHVTLTQARIAMTSIIRERVVEGQNRLLTVGQDAAHSMPWNTLMKMMTAKYCPQNEIKKLEIEIWELKSDKIEKYVSGLPDMIHGSVMASKPKTMQDAIEFTTELMDKNISTLAKCQAENKRKLDNNNQAQQQPPKNQGVAIAYTTESGERKEYVGTLPLWNKYQAGGTGARGMVHALGGGEINQDLNNMEDDINA
ncbi:hypothetical protein Tco_0869244 [Tanacetum coccineum]